MIKRSKNKKGQLYIVAAIIIVLVILGIGSVKTFSVVKNNPRQVGELSAELSEEGIRIIDYGMYNEVDPALRDKLIENFIKDNYVPYFIGKTNNANIFFVYGNRDNLKLIEVEADADTGSITAVLGAGAISWSNLGTYIKKTDLDGSGSDVQVEILGILYDFELRNNEMFYFFINQKSEEEIYVDRN